MPVDGVAQEEEELKAEAQEPQQVGPVLPVAPPGWLLVVLLRTHCWRLLVAFCRQPCCLHNLPQC